MTNIANVAGNRPVAQPVQDLNTTSSVFDRKVTDINLLSTVKTKDLSNYRLDAQGGLYKLGTIGQVFRSIGDVFTSNSSLKNRNMEVAAKILDMRHKAVSMVNISSFGKAIHEFGDSVKAKVQSMNLSEEESLAFTSYIDLTNTKVDAFTSDAGATNIYGRLTSLNNLEKEMHQIIDTLNSKDSMDRVTTMMRWSVDVISSGDYGSKNIRCSQNLVDKLGQKITQQLENTSLANKTLATLCIDKLGCDVDSLKGTNLHILDTYTELYKDFALELAKDENSDVIETSFFNKLLMNECDKFFMGAMKSESKAVHAEFERHMLETLRHSELLNSPKERNISIETLISEVADNVYRTHFNN